MSRLRPKVFPSGGIINDLPAVVLGNDGWSGGRNVVFRPYATRIAGHASRYGTIQTEVRSLLNAPIGGVNYWIYHGKSKSYAVTGTTHTDITISGGLSTVTAPNQWTVGLLNGLPFANNFVDKPMYWDGNTAHDFVVLPGWDSGTRAYSLRPYKYYLIAMNVSSASGNFTSEVMWSNAAAPGAMPTAWSALSTNDAGASILAESVGGIIDGFPLASSFVLYKQHSAYSMDWIPGNDVFAFRKLPIPGILSRNCSETYRGQHLNLIDGDIVATDGNAWESIGEDRMKQFLFRQLDQSNFGACFVTRNVKADEVWFCFPSAGNSFCDLALVWSRGKFGVREIPDASCGASGIVNDMTVDQTWAGANYTWAEAVQRWGEETFSDANDALVLGMPNDAAPTSSKFYEMDSGTTADGDNIGAVLSKYTMDFGEPERVKLVKRVIPIVDADPGTIIYIRVGSQMTPNGATTWTAEEAFTAGTSEHVNIVIGGKFLSFEFRSDGIKGWTIPGFEVELDRKGFH